MTTNDQSVYEEEQGQGYTWMTMSPLTNYNKNAYNFEKKPKYPYESHLARRIAEPLKKNCENIRN